MVLTANSLRFLSVAPSIKRAKSYVTRLLVMTVSTPAMIASAALVQPMSRSIISPERITVPGLILSWSACFSRMVLAVRVKPVLNRAEE